MDVQTFLDPAGSQIQTAVKAAVQVELGSVTQKLFPLDQIRVGCWVQADYLLERSSAHVKQQVPALK